jgi:hypothetical protein
LSDGTDQLVGSSGTTVRFGFGVGWSALAFATGGTEGMRLTSTGLGIGTSSVVYPLHVEKAKAGDALVSFKNTSATGDGLIIQIADNAYNALRIFDSAGSPSFRVKGSGETYIASNVGIGTSSPGAKLDVAGSGYIRGDSTNATFTDAGQLAIKRSTSSPFMSFHGDTGTRVGYIQMSSSGASAIVVQANQALQFATNDTERARITAAGEFLVGTTSLPSGSVGGLQLSSGNYVYFSRSSGESINVNRFTTEGSVMSIRYAGTQVGTISVTASATAYNTSSDQRLKENIQDSDSASSLIDSLQVRQFDWKLNGSHQRYGFVAQELVTVAPEAVYQPEDTDEMMAVDYSKLVPMLVKEIQSLRQRLSAANL